MDERYESPRDYLRMPYARVLTPDDETGTFTAEILEFPGCIAQGDTPEEAYGNLESVAEGWIQSALNMGQEIPNPSDPYSYSGRIALRLPRGLHRRAAQMAERDGTSLNQFLVSAIAEQVGANRLYERVAQKLEQQAAQAAMQTAINNAIRGAGLAGLAIRGAGLAGLGGMHTLDKGRAGNSPTETPPKLMLVQGAGGG